MRDFLDHLLAEIVPVSAEARQAARARQAQLTKPPGSLGQLEDLAVQLAGIGVGQIARGGWRKAILVMAGDHGVTVEGVSAYPSDVTAQMVGNFLAGGAAINQIAAQVGAQVIVVDIGVATPLDLPGLIARKVAPGTANMALGPAMTVATALAAIQVGAQITREAATNLDLIGIGEMGIGNTTAAAAITAALTGAPVATVTGRGTGLDDVGRDRKVAVITRALSHLSDPEPLTVLAGVGGLEIAGMVGAMLAAAAARIPVVLDGFISGAAALVAVRLCPTAGEYLIAGHRSVEPGHQIILQELGRVPLLDLGLRLGEGTGAALAMPIIEAAWRAHWGMATFTEAGVSDREA